MKKMINDVEKIVEEMLQGIVQAHPWLKRVEGFNVLVRKDAPIHGKVAVISGGGSGHEPLAGGYVGAGMLDGAVAGAIFTSPTPDQIYEAIQATQAGQGVLLVILNYSGDIMNFEIAAEMAEADGIQIEKVIVNDDVAVEDSSYTTGRRGIAGTSLIFKVAGAKAATGATLEEVKKTTNKAIANLRSMGMALSSCTVPAAGKPIFTLDEDEVEIGMGLHGEPGTHREKIRTADETAEQLAQKIFDDISFADGDEVAVMINSLGGTPLMELYIIHRKVATMLAEKNVKIVKSYVGNYMTSMEMAGFSISILKLDDELKELLFAPAETSALVQN